MNTTSTDRLIRFRVPTVPVAQPRHRTTMINGKPLVFGAKQNHPIHQFKATVALAATEARNGGGPLDGPLYLAVVFVLPRPKQMVWKKRPMPRIPHHKRPDCDNLIKGVMDALSGLLWRDDSQVFSIDIEKYYASGSESPHCTIQVFTPEALECRTD